MDFRALTTVSRFAACRLLLTVCETCFRERFFAALGFSCFLNESDYGMDAVAGSPGLPPNVEAQRLKKNSGTALVLTSSTTDPALTDWHHHLQGHFAKVLTLAGDDLQNLQTKVSATASSSIVLVAGDAAPDSRLIQWYRQWDAASETSDLCLAIASQRSTGESSGQWLSSILMWLQYWLMRICFGIRKSAQHGALLCYPQRETLLRHIQELQEILHASDRPQQVNPRVCIDDLLCHAALNQARIAQVEFAPQPAPVAGLSQVSAQPPRVEAWQTAFGLCLTTLRACWNRRWFPGESSKLRSPTEPSFEAEAADAGLSLAVKAAAIAVLFSAAILVLTLNLNYPLFEPDEARNAQLALNIYETGDWVMLRLGPELYWDKPPAVAWGTAISYWMFGVSPWSTRLLSNLCALATIGLTFGLGWRLIGFRAAWWGALLLTLSTGFVICGRYATMDATITLCCTGVLGFAYLAICGTRLRYSAWCLAAILAGVGLLVKGPVVLVLTFPPLLAWLWLSGNTHLNKIVPWVLFAAIALLLAGPWFIAMGLVEPEFLLYFFWKHHVVRFSDAFNHREPFWYYGPALILGMFPASLLLPTLVGFFRSRSAAYAKMATSEVGFLALIAIWIVGFFSLSDSKLPTYILPAFPAVALLLGFSTQYCLLAMNPAAGSPAPAAVGVLPASGTGNAWWLRMLGKCVQIPTLGQWLQSVPRRVAVSLLSALLIFGLVSRWIFQQPGIPWTLLVLGGIGTLITGLVWLDRAQPRRRLAGTLILAALFVATIVSQILPGLSQYRSIRQAAAALHRQPELNRLPILFFGHEDYGMTLALPEQETVSFDDVHIVHTLKFLSNHPRCLIVSDIDSIEILRCNLATRWEISSIKGARHVYLCHELDVPDPAVQSIADRLKPVTLR